MGRKWRGVIGSKIARNVGTRILRWLERLRHCFENEHVPATLSDDAGSFGGSRLGASNPGDCDREVGERGVRGFDGTESVDGAVGVGLRAGVGLSAEALLSEQGAWELAELPRDEAKLAGIRCRARW